ncbi:MAG: hypothetical protein ACKO96_24575, partial [Flammeovirgaceae bacterium]
QDANPSCHGVQILPSAPSCNLHGNAEGLNATQPVKIHPGLGQNWLQNHKYAHTYRWNVMITTKYTFNQWLTYPYNYLNG